MFVFRIATAFVGVQVSEVAALYAVIVPAAVVFTIILMNLQATPEITVVVADVM
jgi:hypothetical protein